MNRLKENPVGLDHTINQIQEKLYNKLNTLWGLELEGYPRCYSVKRESKKTIEHYLGNGEYENMIFAERNKFFFVGDSDYTQEDFNHFTSKTDLYFIINLEECKPNITHRADEEVRKDILNILKTCERVRPNVRVVTGVDSIFMGFQRENIDDMQPYFFFKAILEITEFSMNNNC